MNVLAFKSRRTSAARLNTQAVSVLLLLAGCIGQASKPEGSTEPALPEVMGSPAAPAISVRGDHAPVALTWEECAPEAAAAFERLARDQEAGTGLARPGEDLALLMKACDAGDLAVCNGLGIVHIEGHGIDPDQAKGLGFFRRACKGGLAVGCFNLALLHDPDNGVLKDAQEAARYLSQACELENVIACQALGFAYASGRGVPKDFGRAAPFYEKACAGGWSPGCTNLAGLYKVGAGVEKDPAKARTLYTRACELGSREACAAAKR